MTVRELIARLVTMDQDLPVVYLYGDGFAFPEIERAELVKRHGSELQVCLFEYPDMDYAHLGNLEIL